MKTLLKTASCSFIILVTLGLFSSAQANVNSSGKPSPEDILKKADEVRNPSDSFEMMVEVLTNPDKDAKPGDIHIPHDKRSLFQVSIEGNDKTLIQTKAPKTDKGRNLLMRGENMWAYIPNLGRAVRVSLAQKLTGQAANGDISRMRWSGDYDVTIEKDNKKEWVLFLNAKKKGLTYEKLRIWVDKENYHPIQAEFLTLSGKTLKTAKYENFQTIEGKMRPTWIKIQDGLRADQVSLIQIQSMKSKTFRSSLFNQNAMNR